MTDAAQWYYPAARILVFGKSPRAGLVKTRLAKSIGAERAARAYRQWLESTVAQLSRAALAPVELWMSPDTQHPVCRHLAQVHDVQLHTQPDGHLGQRMHDVMSDTLRRCRSAVLIGSDCPVMVAEYVQRALAVLETGVDTVLGPAEDGGYVLLGLRRIDKALFNGIPWSTARVLQATRRQLRAGGHGWAELETLWDIDCLDDYRRWQAGTTDRCTTQASKLNK
jgi:rSAM/selenodomain-associated transferase 1